MNKLIFLTAFFLLFSLTSSEAGTRLRKTTPEAGKLIKDASFYDRVYNGVPFLYGQEISQNIAYISDIFFLSNSKSDGETFHDGFIKIRSSGVGTVQYDSVKNKENVFNGYPNYLNNLDIPKFSFENSGIVYDAGEVKRILDRGIRTLNRTYSTGSDWYSDIIFSYDDVKQFNEDRALLRAWAASKNFFKTIDILDNQGGGVHISEIFHR